MELQSEKIGSIATALAKAQGAFEGAKKSANNPHLNRLYADINSVLDVVRAPLSENGIAMTQPCIFIEGRQCVMTQITHAETGEWMRSVVPVFEGNQKGAQGYGSGVTYARRYGLSALLGVGAEDDDGHGASGPGARPADDRAPKQKADDKAPPPVSDYQIMTREIDSIDKLSLASIEPFAKHFGAKWEGLNDDQRDLLKSRMAKRAAFLAGEPDGESAPAKANDDLSEAPFQEPSHAGHRTEQPRRDGRQ